MTAPAKRASARPKSSCFCMAISGDEDFVAAILEALRGLGHGAGVGTGGADVRGKAVEGVSQFLGARERGARLDTPGSGRCPRQAHAREVVIVDDHGPDQIRAFHPLG